MINEFIEYPINMPYAEIPSGYLKPLRRAYQKGDYEFCAELALCLMDMCLYGKINTDNERVIDILEPNIDKAKDKVISYVDKVKNTQESIIFGDSLDVIADLYKSGKTQKEIALILTEHGTPITQSTVSRRLKKIKEEFPYLLE